MRGMVACALIVVVSAACGGAGNESTRPCRGAARRVRGAGSAIQAEATRSAAGGDGTLGIVAAVVLPPPRSAWGRSTRCGAGRGCGDGCRR